MVPLICRSLISSYRYHRPNICVNNAAEDKRAVAYTLLFNHIPINGYLYLIGTNDYEVYYIFGGWYRNTIIDGTYCY